MDSHLLSSVAVEYVLGGEIRVSPIEKGELTILLHPMSLYLDTRPRIFVTFPEGNGEL